MMTSSIKRKSTAFNQAERFKTHSSISPSPDTYKTKSFIESNKMLKKGSEFPKNSRVKSYKNGVPGPGNYQTKYNPETQFSYTMRKRINTEIPGHVNSSLRRMLDLVSTTCSTTRISTTTRTDHRSTATRESPRLELTSALRSKRIPIPALTHVPVV